MGATDDPGASQLFQQWQMQNAAGPMYALRSLYGMAPQQRPPRCRLPECDADALPAIADPEGFCGRHRLNLERWIHPQAS